MYSRVSLRNSATVERTIIAFVPLDRAERALRVDTNNAKMHFPTYCWFSHSGSHIGIVEKAQETRFGTSPKYSR